VNLFLSLPKPHLSYFSASINILVNLLDAFATFLLIETGLPLHFLPLEQPYCVSLFSANHFKSYRKISFLPCLLTSGMSLCSCIFFRCEVLWSTVYKEMLRTVEQRAQWRRMLYWRFLFLCQYCSPQEGAREALCFCSCDLSHVCDS